MRCAGDPKKTEQVSCGLLWAFIEHLLIDYQGHHWIGGAQSQRLFRVNDPGVGLLLGLFQADRFQTKEAPDVWLQEVG